MPRIYFDGGARPNPGQMEAAVVVEGGQKLRRALGHGTNNVAEWTACLWALEVAHELGFTEVEIAGDSQLVVHQAAGEWKVRHEDLRPFKVEFDRVAAQFAYIRMVWVPRDINPAGWLLET